MKYLILLSMVLCISCSKEKGSDETEGKGMTKVGLLNKNITVVKSNYFQFDLNGNGIFYNASAEINLLTLNYQTSLKGPSLDCKINADVPLVTYIQLKNILSTVEICRNTRNYVCPLSLVFPFNQFMFFSSSGLELTVDNVPLANCSLELFNCDSSVASDLTTAISTQIKKDILLCH